MIDYEFMTNEQKIIDYLSDEGHRDNGYCDDCLSNVLKIKPRQTVNQICRRLKKNGRLTRIKTKCALCGKEKISNFNKVNESRDNEETKYLHYTKKDENIVWDYKDEWFEETNIGIVIRDYLIKNGHKIIKFNEDKKQKGHDMITIKEGIKTVVEFKGYPSDKYVSGVNKGKKKPTSPNLQAKHWFSEALLSLILAKCNDWDIVIAMGLPKFRKYEELVKKIEPLREKIGLKCYLVSNTGKVEEV